MKKSLGLIFIITFVLGILIISGCFAEVLIDEGEQSVDNVREDLEEGKEKIDEAKEYTDKEKWEYLSQEWREMLLQKGKPLYYIDSFFEKISFVFMIMLGEGYSFSIIFFFIFIFWLYLFLEVSKIMRLFLSMNGFIPYGISFAVVSLIGQTGTLRFAIEFFGDLLAELVGFMFWIVLFVILFAFFGLGRFIGKVGEAFQRQKEIAEKEQAEWDRYVLHRWADAVSEGFMNTFKR